MNDGGAVSPIYDVMHDRKTGLFVGLGVETKGITLQDYFAGQVISGSMSGLSYTIKEKNDAEALAREAYFIADAMLSVRTQLRRPE